MLVKYSKEGNETVNYTLNKNYDLEEIFNYEANSEERIQLLEDRHIVKYRTKTIKAGNVLECEVYPIWNTQKSMGRLPKVKESRDTQKRLNAKNATKNAIRLINTNFTEKDIWCTLTYETKQLPKTVEDAEKIFANYLRRLKYYGAKHNFPELKYLFTTEFEEDEEKGKKRVHHHIVTNFPDRDVAEKLWKCGARKQTRRLQADENGFEGMSRYIMKDPKGTKRYKTSRNLKKPLITIADTKFSRKRVIKLIEGEKNPKTEFESLYQGYRFLELKHRESEYVTGTYLYIKMTRKEVDKLCKKRQ